MLADLVKENEGPPVNIEAIIRGFDIELDKKAELHQDISGQIEPIDGGRYKISVNRDQHYYRQRFTMAHELAHFLYHSHLIGEGVDDNMAYRSVQDGVFFNPNISNKEETEANKFASVILMPAHLVKSYWAKLGDLGAMGKLFQVSQPAIKIRLKSLGIDIG